MKNLEKKLEERIDKKVGPAGKLVLPIIGAVIVVAVAVAYICLKLADNVRYNEKWKDYEECGWH